MSPGLRGRVVGALVAAVTTSVSAHAQAPLTAADSAILASQPLKRLALAPSLLRRVSLLAAGLDREGVLCLQGAGAGDSGLVGDFVVRDVLSSAVGRVEPPPRRRTAL